jgi:ferredoxin
MLCHTILSVACVQEWADLGLHKFAVNGEYREAYAAINQLMNVNNRFSYRPRKAEDEGDNHDDPEFVVNGVNHYLWDASVAAGHVPQRISRNVKNCVDCGNCLFGCPYGSKQSTVTGMPQHRMLLNYICAELIETLLFFHCYQLYWNHCRQSSTSVPHALRTRRHRLIPLVSKEGNLLSSHTATLREFCKEMEKLWE